MLYRCVCQSRFLPIAATVVSLTVSFEKTQANIIDVTQLPEFGAVVAPEAPGFAPRRSTSMLRRHCRTLAPPPIRCFSKRNRNLDCCPRGGSSGSAGSGGFAHNDFAALGFHQSASGSENGIGGGGGSGGGGGGSGIAFNPSVEPTTLPPAHAPGPIAGAGFPGLLILAYCLHGWWRRRQSRAANGN